MPIATPVPAAAPLPFLHQWERARYSPVWLCSRPSEAEVQRHILKRLELHSVAAFPVDAGAKTIRGRARGALTRAGADPAQLGYILAGKGGAAQKGVVDIIGVLPGGRALFIEVKRPEWLEVTTGNRFIQHRSPGKPSEDQITFLRRMHHQGALVGVAWSADDVPVILAGVA